MLHLLSAAYLRSAVRRRFLPERPAPGTRSKRLYRAPPEVAAPPEAALHFPGQRLSGPRAFEARSGLTDQIDQEHRDVNDPTYERRAAPPNARSTSSTPWSSSVCQVHPHRALVRRGPRRAERYRMRTPPACDGDLGRRAASMRTGRSRTWPTGAVLALTPYNAMEPRRGRAMPKILFGASGGASDPRRTTTPAAQRHQYQRRRS